ncbi:MAG: MarR family transcriptional regulator [Luteimonas sp.]|nr:MarR family transcriptional regulator [Luteimonas sp.]
MHLQDVMAASRRVHAAIDSIDALISQHLGVQRSDLRCLNLLEHGPVTAGEIAARIGLTSGSVTALVDRLERAGFVERRRSSTDRRSVEVAIPDAAFGRIAPLYRQVGQAVMGQFSSMEADALAQAGETLAAFAGALEAAAAGLAPGPRPEGDAP